MNGLYTAEEMADTMRLAESVTREAAQVVFARALRPLCPGELVYMDRDVRWYGARQDRSDFPDVDQMLCDVGPVIDQQADEFFRYDLTNYHEKIRRDIATGLRIPGRLYAHR